ncbi:nucleoside transporter-domain-containing protein [Chaetomium sp. MPI-SDFR-AT-0129]|nr:nucleoside transporter-domain-containing protein [Chaetomium sp. MPI-SDFR-AT-0129]
MDRIRAFFRSSKTDAEEYEPLADDDSGTLEGSGYDDGSPFSWVEYFIFALIGVAMLWAWNMFLAAAPYFQTRFVSDPWIYANSQSAVLTTSTVVNLATMIILTNIQSSANYAFRINVSLYINAVVFALLAISTTHFLGVAPSIYLVFLLLTVALTALASGLMQNGAFSFAASFGRPEYTQAIMAGQGVAGILPPLTQMVSFLIFTDTSPGIPPTKQPSNSDSASEGGTAAFTYFLTAVIISAVTLVAFIPLVRRRKRLHEERLLTPPEADLASSVTTLGSSASAAEARRYVPITTLFRKLGWIAASVAMCFVAAMFFPVYTAKILSVHDPSESGKLFSPGAFIPLGFFFWNLGDLTGRVSTMAPAFGWLRQRPKALFALGMVRWAFLPLYMLCNLHGRGAVVSSDLFYLLLVQFPFGLTNGWLGSSAMMAAGEWVAEDEREAAGGFMSMCLVGGLALGSMLSFTAAGV